jgi:hypothetical protein
VKNHPRSQLPKQQNEFFKQIWKEKTEWNFIVLFNSINFYYENRNVYLYQNKQLLGHGCVWEPG